MWFSLQMQHRRFVPASDFRMVYPKEARDPEEMEGGREMLTCTCPDDEDCIAWGTNFDCLPWCDYLKDDEEEDE